MMRWCTGLRFVRRHQCWKHIHHGGVSSRTGKVPFSSSVKLAAEISSTLYLVGIKGTTSDGVVTPYLDFSKQFQDLTLLKHYISLRNIDVDIDNVIKNWSEWKELEKCKSDIENKKEDISKMLNILKHEPNNENQFNELKDKGKQLRVELKAVKSKIQDIEEVAVMGALNLPNDLHDMTKSYDKLVFSFSGKPEFGFHPKSHIELGTKSEELEILNNSPTSYYLRNRLALLDLVCNDYFLSDFTDEGFVIMSNIDFVKSTIVEGCGIHFRDRPFHNKISAGVADDQLHLVGGGSLQSFSAFFTKQIFEKSDQLPYKVMTAGRNYSPKSLNHPGLLGCRQSNVVDGFILYEDMGMQEKTLLQEVIVMAIKSYFPLGMHFQLVQYAAKKLENYESAAIGILMFSPHTGSYHEVGRISLCGDYISKRLWTLCRKDKAVSFVSTLHIRLCHTARLLALMMENRQEEDATYSLPECFQSAVESF